MRLDAVLFSFKSALSYSTRCLLVFCLLTPLQSSYANETANQDDAELIKLRIKELELKKEILELEAKKEKRNTYPAPTPQSYSAPHSNSVDSSRFIRGPRGGCYTYSASGNKRYVDRSLCN
ncbi:MAG: hypothetical protein ACT6QL_08510 [Methylophilus sp.]|uniref:hypothetical protein n=1 Tax=Methylophilus sp. TaxID=29541 RepID=UPI0040351429